MLFFSHSARAYLTDAWKVTNVQRRCDPLEQQAGQTTGPASVIHDISRNEEVQMWATRDSASVRLPGVASTDPLDASVRPAILIVDDELDIRHPLFTVMQRAGYEPAAVHDGQIALDTMARTPPALVVLDLQLPGRDGLSVLRLIRKSGLSVPIILVTAFDSEDAERNARQSGASAFLKRPFENCDLLALIAGLLTGAVAESLIADAHPPDRQRSALVAPLSLCRTAASTLLANQMGPSECIARILKDVECVAPSEFTVLITGETGTGKEVLARAIHDASPRCRHPFVAVDCGAIPETLFESEFFGFEKGAFTGADRCKPGRFELAEGGTLFLDEIGNLPVSSQVKLLRALQDRCITRVGGTKVIHADVVILAATSQDLRPTAEASTFRRDLFYRLNDYSIEIPPLRERVEDIPYLADRFRHDTNLDLKKNVRGFSKSAVELMARHGWPGNVRELRSVVRRAVLVANRVIEPEHLGSLTVSTQVVAIPSMFQRFFTNGLGLRELVKSVTAAVERETLIETLRKTAGNKAEAARLLRIDYKTIHTKIKEYAILVERPGRQSNDGED